MRKKDQKFLFVIGGQKSGTSTMVGLLNCHPDVFIMHEWFIDKKPSKHGHSFYTSYKIPEKYRANKRKGVIKCYRRLRYFACNEYDYKYFGDKWPRMRGGFNAADVRINGFSESYVIYMVRDLRTWLCHPKIQGLLYRARDNVVGPAAWYVYYFIRSFKLNNCLRIRMEDLVEHEQVVKQVDSFLTDIDCSCMNNWWEKVGKYEDNVKILHKWWLNHKSSLVKPTRLDIDVSLKQHDFWDTILPIFDKYYSNPNGVFCDDEINEDLQFLRKFHQTSGVSAEECYERVTIEKVL